MANVDNSVLLILDDEPMIVRLITRWFKHDFSEIHYATTPVEAEALLASKRITHFVCDANLGPDQPQGIELINRWYPMYPDLEKAVLFTGMALDSVPTREGVQIISKGDDPNVLLSHLKSCFSSEDAQA